MLRVNPKALANLGLSGSLVNGDSDTTQTGEVFTKLAAKKCLKDCDANKDGVISRDEVKISDAAYAKLDADGDGKVTKAELNDALSGHGSEVMAFYSKRGKSAKSTDLLETILTGGATRSNAGYVEAAAKKYIRNKDTNKNGTLEKGEVNFSTDVFSKIDTDKNGSISLAEMKTALKGQDAKLAAYFKNSTNKNASDLTSSLLGTI